MPKLLILIFIFSFQISTAQYRIYSNEFLSVGIGARALAMSNSVIASTNDVNSGYWNPAALTSQKMKYDISAMHSEYFAGIAKLDYIGASQKVNDSTVFGITIIRFGIDNIPNTLELIDENGNVDYNRITFFSVADYAFLFSYAKKTQIKELSYGVNLKIIYRNQGEFANAYGFGFDVGIKYNKNKWLFGANLRDATTTFNAWFYNNESLENVFLQTGNELPTNSIELTAPKLLIGIGKEFKLSEKFNLLTEIGSDFSFDGKKHILISNKVFSLDPHIGFELDLKKIIFIRFGVGNFALIKNFDQNSLNFQPSGGIGLNLFNFSIDYALTDIGDQSIALYSNIFSVRYSFNRIKRTKASEFK